MTGEHQDKPATGGSDRDAAKEAGKPSPADQKTPVDQDTQREAAEERKQQGGYD